MAEYKYCFSVAFSIGKSIDPKDVELFEKYMRDCCMQFAKATNTTITFQPKLEIGHTPTLAYNTPSGWKLRNSTRDD